jgi:uncharacterized protein YdeI (YjbR/CyaY-like superfamily)
VASEELTLAFASADEWNTWLASHHARPMPAWLRLAKKGAVKSLTYSEALDVALMWGWIDSQKRKHDEHAFAQRFSPRTAKSPWSKINCAKAEALISAGKMKPPGLREVERAKADGRWDRAYAGQKTSTVPDDFAAALTRNARARKFFEALDATNRYAILYRLQAAGKPQTRADRITRFVAMCARGETFHPRKEKKSGTAKPRG